MTAPIENCGSLGDILCQKLEIMIGSTESKPFPFAVNVSKKIFENNFWNKFNTKLFNPAVLYIGLCYHSSLFD